MFLSCKVHPPTVDVTPGGAAALFLGKTSIFQPPSSLLSAWCRVIPAFGAHRQFSLQMEQDLFAGRS